MFPLLALLPALVVWPLLGFGPRTGQAAPTRNLRHPPIAACPFACLPAGGAAARPGSPAGLRGSVLDYIPRGEHVRLLEARLAAKEGDMQLEMGSRLAQVCVWGGGRGGGGAGQGARSRSGCLPF
jgi:hypothetical protein